jgi:hypothetical protein
MCVAFGLAMRTDAAFEHVRTGILLRLWTLWVGLVLAVIRAESEREVDAGIDQGGLSWVYFGRW